MIQFVENHRVSLQLTSQDQKIFHETLRGGNLTTQTSEQEMSVPGALCIGPSNSFGGSPVTRTKADGHLLFLQQQQQRLLQNTVMMHGQPPPQGGPQLQQSPLPACFNRQAIDHAESLIAKYKYGYTTLNIPAMPSVNVPIDQHAEYHRILEKSYKLCLDMEPSLSMIYVLLNHDDLLQKLVSLISPPPSGSSSFDNFKHIK